MGTWLFIKDIHLPTSPTVMSEGSAAGDFSDLYYGGTGYFLAINTASLSYFQRGRGKKTKCLKEKVTWKKKCSGRGSI